MVAELLAPVFCRQHKNLPVFVTTVAQVTRTASCVESKEQYRFAHEPNLDTHNFSTCGVLVHCLQGMHWAELNPKLAKKELSGATGEWQKGSTSGAPQWRMATPGVANSLKRHTCKGVGFSLLETCPWSCSFKRRFGLCFRNEFGAGKRPALG